MNSGIWIAKTCKGNKNCFKKLKLKFVDQAEGKTFGARNQQIGDQVKGLRNPDSTVLLFVTRRKLLKAQ